MINKPDGFPEQRQYLAPESIPTNSPFENWGSITEIGHFPRTNYHYIDRPSGSKHHIFIFNTSGNGFCRILDTVYEIPPYHLLVIPAKTSHHYGAHEKTPWNIYWLHCKGNLVDKYIQQSQSSPNPYIFKLNNSAEILNLFEQCLSALKDNMHSDKNAPYLHKMMATFYLEKKEVKNSQSKISETRIVQSIHWMQENLTQSPSLQSLSSLSHLSTAQYSALFKEQTGTSPLRFFNRLKMQRACSLIINTSSPINLIALDLGYEDPFYFCRIFKKIIGVSPLQYRKSQRPHNEEFPQSEE